VPYSWGQEMSAGAVDKAPARRALARTRITPVAWLAHVELTVEEWRAQGSRLGSASRSTNWWLGDWVRFGAAHHGQKYEIAASVTGYDEQTLMNMVYVASRFQISRRREIPSWSHHAELAALDHPEQDFWLDRTTTEHLSVRGLRRELREALRIPPIDPTAIRTNLPAAVERVPVPDSQGGLITCPHCGGRFEVIHP
jgi:hypothetical protein